MDEIELRIRKAEKLLQDAKREFEMGLYGRCCSTSYYAMFHAAKAMVLSLGKDSRTHRGITQRNNIPSMGEQRKAEIERE